MKWPLLLLTSWSSLVSMNSMVANAQDWGQEEGFVCEDGAPFDCPIGTHCSDWTDGCNDCICNWKDKSIPAMCSIRVCSCYDDNTCLPVCHDNPECVPRKSTTTTTVLEDNDADGGGVSF